MKRELVVFSVIGGLLWLATGLSVLAVAVFEDDTRRSMPHQVLASDPRNPAHALAGQRSRDEVTSAPLCEEPEDASPSGSHPDAGLRSTDGRAADDDCGTCWDRDAVSLLRICLLFA
jgi:hypothetical protein